MAKSRVEKNKALYEELELDSFELEDITETKKIEPIKEEKIIEEVKVEEKKKKTLPAIKKKNEVAVVKEKEDFEEDFVVEQPISYTSKLSVEEILRAKLEKQQQLKDSKKVAKKSPITNSYTPEMMQKNISQNEGVDIRKEANIRVKKNNNKAIALLVFMLLVVIAGGIVAGFLII